MVLQGRPCGRLGRRRPPGRVARARGGEARERHLERGTREGPFFRLCRQCAPPYDISVFMFTSAHLLCRATLTRFLRLDTVAEARRALLWAQQATLIRSPYLEAIGAVMEDANGDPISDAISGAMCWCPITCLDEADAAYEWMMGQFGSSSTREDGTWTAALSGDLARSYADYVNKAGFVDENGSALTLGES